jgi:serine/threonine-protein kinase HipA
MAKTAAILAVHLLDSSRGPVRVGTITRDGDGAVSFSVAESYLRDEDRPILSLAWHNPFSDENSRDRLASRNDKIGVNGSLPPWFSGLLPEGALRELVLAEMGPGDHDQFDVLTRLGADLPGAVLVIPETQAPISAGPLDFVAVAGFKAASAQGLVKFSLAGVQLKFTGNADGDRLTLPGQGDSGRCIVKVASERYQSLPETEYAAMSLARLIGVNAAPCRLVPSAAVHGVPSALLGFGESVLVVDRFDRAADDIRIHIEDAAQVLGAVGDRKYTMATTETVLNMINRFSTDRRTDVLEAIRRIVADTLLGNGDSHLKNWSFLFPQPGQVRLSPAYDIVPTILYQPRDTMALQFAGTNSFDGVTLRRFDRVASFLQLDPRLVRGEVKTTIQLAQKLWPDAARALLSEEHANTLMRRMQDLTIVREISA